MKSTDFRDYKDGLIYIIGIGGCSTSGLAQILHNMGYRVTGSDMLSSDCMEEFASPERPQAQHSVRTSAVRIHKNLRIVPPLKSIIAPIITQGEKKRKQKQRLMNHQALPRVYI